MRRKDSVGLIRASARTEPALPGYPGSNPSIASVSNAGVVKLGDKRGVATITATTAAGKTFKARVQGVMSLDGAKVAGIAKKTYTGKEKRPVPKVTLDGKKLAADKDFTVSYSNNVNAGTATLTITGCGVYKGTKTATFKIAKAKNTAKISSKQKTVKFAKLKKKAQVVWPLSVKKAKGKTTYAKMAKGSSKRLSVNKSTGKVIVKKGTAKGLYKVRIKVKVAGDKNHKSITKIITAKICVK